MANRLVSGSYKNCVFVVCESKRVAETSYQYFKLALALSAVKPYSGAISDVQKSRGIAQKIWLSTTRSHETQQIFPLCLSCTAFSNSWYPSLTRPGLQFPQGTGILYLIILTDFGIKCSKIVVSWPNLSQKYFTDFKEHLFAMIRGEFKDNLIGSTARREKANCLRAWPAWPVRCRCRMQICCR